MDAMSVRRASGPARWVLIAAGSVAVIAVGGWLLLGYLRPRVSVTEAVMGPVIQAFYSTGTVQPVRDYPIRSNIEGILTEVRVDKGDRVNAGQPLATVEVPELRFRADQAQAELEEKQKRADPQTSPVLAEYHARIQAATELLAIAQREQDRLQALVGRDAASSTDLDRAIDRVKVVWTELETAKAQMAIRQLELDKDLQVAQAGLKIARWSLDQQTLRSPIDGTVLDWPVPVGTRVAVNDRIMLVADVQPKNLVMRAAVDEEDITRVRPGQTVHMTLYAFPDRTFVGVVQRVYDQADENRRTFEVDVHLSEPSEELQPGMTGELAFILQSRESAVVVPSQAVQGGVVYLLRDGRVEPAKVVVGLTSIERTEIVSGIKPGDRVIITPIGSIAEGQAVRASLVDPLTAAGLNKKQVEEQPFKAFD
jgi:HlyD family secretion protein